ncbi:zinc transporter zip9-like [Stylonychia lemnae]|uniref:Zinc transporter zip9-like n=1 Tax=Stylonychia lemnae TaxID=5949 RepID=A0A077ZQF5_STYLE|nr:zinc transporter zip9-like [Stylonychia lemnae]|eukprot:CDW71694.1 zinc transporter zip9-like [Stylonychia lemnae]
MDHSIIVVLMNLGMFVITFLMGFLPSKLNTSQRIMNLIAIFGAGLLVGASIIVIVPEGMLVLIQSMQTTSIIQETNPVQNQIQAFQESQDGKIKNFANLHQSTERTGAIDPQVTKYIGLSLIIGFTIMLILDQSFLMIKERQMQKGHKGKNGHEKHEEGRVVTFVFKSDEELRKQEMIEPLLNTDEPCSIEKKRERKHSKCHEKVKLDEHKLEEVSKHLHLHQKGELTQAHEHYHGGKENIIVSTIGLVIHSLADGVALVSTKSAQSSGLGVLIFLAILLHKAPAAIGFGTFLYHEGLRGLQLSKYLFAFTSTCPLAAIISFFSLMIWEEGAEDPSQLMFWVGILLLLSAGSFIYVATIHILPEVYCNTDIHRPHTHSHLPEDHIHDEEHFSKLTELITIIIGLYVPYGLMLFHSH